MSANEIQNLLVRIEPEGVDSTTESLEQQSQQFEDTADEVGEQSSRLEDFSQRWSGAMTAIVAGLAIGAAGLATQVPVVGELMGGLTAIIDALAFQIDRALRPALGDLTSEFFDISEAMFAADGPIEALDILAEKIGDVAATSISIAIEEDVVATAVDNLVEIVFPRVTEGDLLTAIFSFDLSGAAVVTALFGATSIAAARVLSFLLPATITAPMVLGFVFPVLVGSAIISHVFDVNMTEVLILSSIFAGVTLTAQLILGATFGAVVITGSAIIGVLFAGITITAGMVLRHLFGPGFDKQETPGTGTATGGGAGSFGRVQFTDPDTLRAIQSGELSAPGTFSPIDNPRAAPMATRPIQMDGRDLSEDTGRYRVDRTTRRGRGP